MAKECYQRGNVNIKVSKLGIASVRNFLIVKLRITLLGTGWHDI